MLTISNPLSAGQARSYHQKEFTAKEQTYWSQRGVVAGEWQGRLAAQLGLARTVSAEDFAKLSQGQHPQTGDQVVRQRASYEYQEAAGNNLKMMGHRAGWDATCSAPRSVSLTPLVGTDRRVREAHRESVGVALDPFEHRSQQFATAVYQSELTNRVRQLGYEITTGRSGAPETKGYTAGYLDISSPRSQQIREYLECTDRSGREAAETAAHSARDHKEIHSPREVIAAHRKLAAKFGYQAQPVVRAARERSQLEDKPVNSFDRVRESLTFSRAKNFEREAVVDERALIRDSLSRGIGVITHAQVRANLDARVASGEFQIVGRSHIPDRPFTPAKTIEAEPEIVRRMQGGQNQIEQVLSHPRAMAVASVTGKKQHPIRCRGPKSFCPPFFPTQPAPITWRFPSVSGVCDERRTAAPLTAPRR